jgi:hypothetical protein
MAGRLIGLSLLAAVGFLLLFSTTGHVSAVTIKAKYTTRLSCAGRDGVYGNADDSCVENATYKAYGSGLTADVVSHFEIPTAAPLYSQYQHLATFGTPVGWKLASDKEIPDGAAIGHLMSLSTLGLFGSKCGDVTLTVDIPMYDCTTDNSAGNQIAWNGTLNGANLLYGPKGQLPAGCTHWPTHITDNIGTNIKPKARYMGSTVITTNMVPTQIQFVMFSPGELSSLPAPEASMIDDLGNINYVILNNPLIPAPAGDSLDEFCTPLASETTLWGKTNGSGRLNAAIPPIPAAQGDFWTVHDYCDTPTVDENGDTTINEMCGIQRVKNPICGASGVTNFPGLWGTCSYPDGAYVDSYRDADADGVDNNLDGCPFTFNLFIDGNNNFVDKVCDSIETPGYLPACNPATPQDCDGDLWRNQQDNCPLDAQVNQADTDKDFIGDVCDTVARGGLGPNVPDGKWVNDQPSGAVCVGATDTDGDGWCDATENINPGGGVISRAGTVGVEAKGESEAAGNASTPGLMPPSFCSDLLDNDSDTFIDAADAGCSTPEYKALDYAVVAAANPPGAAPRTCTNYQWYDSTLAHPATPHQNGAGLPVDDDADTTANQLDANCTLSMSGDADFDGFVDALDNCKDTWNPTQMDTDGDQKPGQVPPIPPGGTQSNWFGGDACDPDDDGDGILDTLEWTAGTDAKNICDPVNFDIDGSGIIDVSDIGKFKYPLVKIGSPVKAKLCYPPKDYSICPKR